MKGLLRDLKSWLVDEIKDTLATMEFEDYAILVITLLLFMMIGFLLGALVF